MRRFLITSLCLLSCVKVWIKGINYFVALKIERDNNELKGGVNHRKVGIIVGILESPGSIPKSHQKKSILK